MSQSSENNPDAMMIDPPSAPSRDPRKVDDSVLETMPPHQRHNFVRKRAYLQEAKARRAARKLEKRHQPSELEAMLPAKVQPEVRNFRKATKAMLGLTTTVKTAFSVGFKFTDDDSVPDEEASNLSESLWLQGTYSLDSIRIQAFVTRLFRSARTCRSSYLQTDEDHEKENQEFFKAVSDDIRAKGIVGGGLGQASHKIEVSPKTCKALHELFVKGRKAYLRDLVESEKLKEGVYTKKMKELIGAVDYWMRFLEQDHEARRGAMDDSEMFTVFNEVAL